jgi:hypothetical protein
MTGTVSRTSRVVAVAALTAVFMAGVVVSGQDVAPIMKGVRAPLDFHPDGKPKTVLYADLARVPPEGEVLAEGVRVEFLDADGRVEATVRTECAAFSRDSKRVASDSRVSVEKGGVLVTGKGWEWSAEKRVVKVHKEVRVVIRGETGAGAGGLLGPVERLRRERKAKAGADGTAQPIE